MVRMKYTRRRQTSLRTRYEDSTDDDDDEYDDDDDNGYYYSSSHQRHLQDYLTWLVTAVILWFPKRLYNNTSSWCNNNKKQQVKRRSRNNISCCSLLSSSLSSCQQRRRHRRQHQHHYYDNDDNDDDNDDDDERRRRRRVITLRGRRGNHSHKSNGIKMKNGYDHHNGSSSTTTTTMGRGACSASWLLCLSSSSSSSSGSTRRKKGRRSFGTCTWLHVVSVIMSLQGVAIVWMAQCVFQQGSSSHTTTTDDKALLLSPTRMMQASKQQQSLLPKSAREWAVSSPFSKEGTSSTARSLRMTNSHNHDPVPPSLSSSSLSSSKKTKVKSKNKVEIIYGALDDDATSTSRENIPIVVRPPTPAPTTTPTVPPTRPPIAGLYTQNFTTTTTTTMSSSDRTHHHYDYYPLLTQHVSEHLRPEERDFLRSCYQVIMDGNGPPRHVFQCHQQKTMFLAYNTLDFPRSYCGIMVLPLKMTMIPADACSKSSSSSSSSSSSNTLATTTKDVAEHEELPLVTYLSADLHVPLDGYGMPPIVIERELDGGVGQHLHDHHDMTATSSFGERLGEDHHHHHQESEPQLLDLLQSDHCDIPCHVTNVREQCGNGNQMHSSSLDDALASCGNGESTWFVQNIAGTTTNEDEGRMVFHYNHHYKNRTPSTGSAGQGTRHYAQPYQYPVHHDFQSAVVPLSYFSWSKYGGHAPPVDYESMDLSIVFLGASYMEHDDTMAAGGAAARSSGMMAQHHHCKGLHADKAHELIRAFQQQGIHVASYDPCGTKVDEDSPVLQLPQGMSMSNPRHRTMLLKEHIFALVVETTTERDYIGEAVWETLHAGVIPIYYGASNIQEHVPPNSIINTATYDHHRSLQTLVEHVKHVGMTKSGWEHYHRWRHGAFPVELSRKFDFLRSSTLCRMCRYAYTKRYGLGWDATEQIPQDPLVSRSLSCLSRTNGLMVEPFVESWYYVDENGSSALPPPSSSSSSIPKDHIKSGISNDCDDNPYDGATISLGTQYEIMRRLIVHDSIFDISIDQILSVQQNLGNNDHHPSSLWFRLQGPVQNKAGVYFRNVHQLMTTSAQIGIMTSIGIQDKSIRMIVIANWVTKVRSPLPGVIDIQVWQKHYGDAAKEQQQDQQQQRKIRIIVEDVDTMRERSTTEFPISIFAKTHLDDFLDPLALFYLKQN